MNAFSQKLNAKKPKNTIFQNIGVSVASEDSANSEDKENEEVRRHLEKMGKELRLENEMQVAGPPNRRLSTKDRRL